MAMMVKHGVFRPSVAAVVVVVLAGGCWFGAGESPPELLADGGEVEEVPEVVAEAVEGPVVGGRITDAARVDLSECVDRWLWDDGPELVGVFVGERVLSVVHRGTGRGAAENNPETALISCDHRYDSGQLHLWRDGWTRTPTDDRFLRNYWHDLHGVGDERYVLSASDVVVPAEAVWVLVRHEGYHVAWRVDGLEIARVSWWGPLELRDDRFPFDSEAIFVDGEGVIVATQQVGSRAGP